MPRSRGSAQARRRPRTPTRLGKTEFVNYGVQGTDAVSGTQFPLRLMVPQRGGLVYQDWDYGSRDVVDEIDGKYQPSTQLALPEPLYRVLNANLRGALMLTEAERDAAVVNGFRWTVPGFAYPRGDEEMGLVKLYRLLNAGNANHLHTISAAEAAAAVVAGFTMEADSVFVAATPALGRVPVSRYYNAVSATHYFTADPLEVARLSGTWVLEGVMFYLWRGPERTRSN